MRRILILISAGALLLAACGGGGGGEAGPAATRTVTVTAEPTSPPASTPQTVAPPQWPTRDVSAPFAGTVPPVPTLAAVRIGTHPEGGYDRVAFEFDKLPGYTVRYQSKIVYDGSGEPVDLDGAAFIQLVFNPCQAHDDDGNSTLPSELTKPVRAGLPALTSYVLNGDFEGYVSVALGVAKKTGFKVDRFRNTAGNYVVYVDVAYP